MRIFVLLMCVFLIPLLQRVLRTVNERALERCWNHCHICAIIRIICIAIYGTMYTKIGHSITIKIDNVLRGNESVPVSRSKKSHMKHFLIFSLSFFSLFLWLSFNLFFTSNIWTWCFFTHLNIWTCCYFCVRFRRTRFGIYLNIYFPKRDLIFIKCADVEPWWTSNRKNNIFFVGNLCFIGNSYLVGNLCSWILWDIYQEKATKFNAAIKLWRWIIDIGSESNEYAQW